MADFIQTLDPTKLVGVDLILSFITSGWAAPNYNLPIFLFGTYALENTESAQSLQIFAALVTASMATDIIWMIYHTQLWGTKIISIILLVLKLPTSFALLAALRQRGTQFTGLRFSGGDLAGATVWSMPGGYTAGNGGRSGYQSVDEPASAPLRQSPPASAQGAPGAYNSV